MEEYYLMQMVNGYMSMLTNVFKTVGLTIYNFMYSWVEDTYEYSKIFFKILLVGSVLVSSLFFIANMTGLTKYFGDFSATTTIKGTTK
jgi:hypothetical protein